ncbi:MAG TPA: MBOAT family O-acyltransferase, partial [Candidatus Sulfotelmatobacter sp.]|nr:MBOAT family O-acyltransferase [Candidatus Sulfotelmatobacter sp.]
LGKKALLADPIAPLADAGYAHADRVQMIGAWGAALAFALQLYFDFSGYCDMAIGLARMLGIRLPQNFASPYKAASIIDYWQRWNITLTRFFTLYLYNPLALRVVRRQAANDATLLHAGAGGPGAFLAAVGLPTVVTMALIGIWHGAGLQFLCFGLLHAAYIIGNHAWRRLRPKRPGAASAGIALGPLRRAGAVLLTFLAVVVAQTFFRAASLPAALAMTEGLLGLRGLGWDAWTLPASDDVGGSAGWLQIALLLAIVWGLPNTQQIMAAYAPTLDPVRRPARVPLNWRPSWPWAIGLGLILMFSIEGIGRSRSFLYFQF